MSAIDNSKRALNKVYIICAAVAVIVLAVIFGLHL